MPSELVHFFRFVLSQHRRRTPSGRRKAFSFSRSSEPLEIRCLLSADPGNLLPQATVAPTDTQSDFPGTQPDETEFDPAIPSVDVAGAYLTSSGHFDAKSFSYNDIAQGQTDDCVFLASLSAVARTDVNLASRITLISQTSTTATYRVKLFREVGSSIVASYENVLYNGFRRDDDAKYGDDGKEIWPILYQRAYLQFANTYSLNYHDYQVALTAITGTSAYTHAISSAGYVAQGFKDFLEDGTPEIVATYNSSSIFINADYGLIANHAYTLMGVELPANGDLSTTYVTVRNPWGYDTTRSFYTANHNSPITEQNYADSLSGLDGADDGLIRLPWSVFSSSFQTYAYTDNVGPSLNTPYRPPVHFDPAKVGPFYIYEGQPLTVNLHAFDPLGGTVLYWTDADQELGNVHPQTGQYTWTPLNWSAGKEIIEVHADVGPDTSATIGFVVYVFPGNPTITSTSASPSPIHDDGSDLITLKATATVPYGQVQRVEFYNDSNNDGTIDINVDAWLGVGQVAGNTWTWQGYIGGLAPGQHHFLAVATRSDYAEFQALADIVATVVHVAVPTPVAIPTAPANMFTVTDLDESMYATQKDAAGNLYVLIDGPDVNHVHHQAVGKFDSTGHFLNAINITESNNVADMLVLPDGSFALIWETYDVPNSGSPSIYLRWYNTNLQSTSGKITVLSGATDHNTYFNAAADAAGNIFFTYQVGVYFDEDIWALSIARNGTVTRAPWLVNSHTNTSQTYPTVALNANGNGVIVWADADQNKLIARPVSSYGLTNGPEFTVTSNFIWYDLTSANVDQAGNIFITWINDGVYFQKFNSAGQPLAFGGNPAGTPLKVNTFGGGDSLFPTIALSSTGWMAVGWGNNLEDGNNGAFVQIFDPSGNKYGPDLNPSANPGRQQSAPVIFIDADGDLTTFWEEATPKTSGSGTYAGNYLRFFNVDLPPAFDSSMVFSIPENSPGGTVIGTVHATDLDPGSTVTYSLQDSTRFQINATTGQITVAPGAVLNYESQSSYSIPVTAASGTKSTLKNVQINLTNVNEAPTLTLNPGTYQFTAHNSPVLVADPFLLADPDTSVFAGGNLTATITNNGTSLDKLSFSAIHGVTVDSSNNVLWNGSIVGTLVSSGVGLNPFQVNLNGNATLAIVQTLLSSLQFEMTGTPSSFLSRTISLTVNDGQLNSSPASRVVTVVDNNAPVLNNLGAPTLTTIPEDVPLASNPGTLISQLIASMSPDGAITDSNPGAQQGIAIDAADTAHGTWQYSTDGAIWSPFSTISISNALLLAADANTRIRFLPKQDFNGTASIDFLAWDQTAGTNGHKIAITTTGGNTAFSSATETASINITPMNEAPVLNPNGNPALASIPEDSFNSSGTSIKDLLANTALGNSYVTDLDAGDPKGIALYSAPSSGGNWQYTVNSGATWNPISGLSQTNALLLAADPAGNTRLRFVPLTNFNGTRKVYFRAWDQSAGINADFANVTTNGNATAFSVRADSAAITVTPVNDAPLLFNALNPVVPTVNKSAINNLGFKVSSMIASVSPNEYITDVDGGPEGIAIYQIQDVGGHWEYSLNNGVAGSWTSIGAVAPNSALLLKSDGLTYLRFVPNGTTTGDRKIYFRAWDQSTGTAGTKVDVSTNGTTTPFSVGADSVTLTVNTVNDAPVLYPAGNPTLPTISKTNSNPAGISILDLLTSAGPNYITDLESTDPQGIAIHAAPASGGTWEYSLDSGAHWTPVGTVDQTHSLLLKAVTSTMIRFKPLPTFTGTRQINFAAWDQSTGTEATKVDTNTRGGTTAFSFTRDTASISIT